VGSVDSSPLMQQYLPGQHVVRYVGFACDK
jgi:hypothetical protein